MSQEAPPELLVVGVGPAGHTAATLGAAVTLVEDQVVGGAAHLWDCITSKVVPLDYAKVARAIFTEPEIASVGFEEVDAAAEGREVRITKVPFAANPRALIQVNPRGFAKVTSDPATHVVLGGSVVGPAFGSDREAAC